MSNDSEVSGGLIACGYVVTLLVPIGGLLGGLMLMVKGAKGHGIVCLVIGVLNLIACMLMFGG